jgi:hypothetical protein
MKEQHMRYGVNLPNFGEYGDPRLLAELAHDAEEAGWDGVFIWDHILISPELVVTDPWIALAAMAMHTKRVVLGPLVTPLARRNPYTVAREVITLDHLSGGRVILGVGLGAPAEAEFEVFGEDGDPKVRAQKLDEALDVVAGLCSGQPFQYDGQFHQLPETTFSLKPVQPSGIPVWVAGYWPNKAPMRRGARWQGVYPVQPDNSSGSLALVPISPEVAREIKSYIAEHRTTDEPFDVVISYDLPPRDAEYFVPTAQEFAEAGVTWLLQEFMPWESSVADARERIRQGPPPNSLPLSSRCR